MNIRHLPLLGSLALSGMVALGACSSSNSSGTGGTIGSVGGTTGSLGGTTGSLGGTAGEAGGAVGSAGGQVGSAGGAAGSAGGQVGSEGGTVGTGAAGASGTCSNVAPCLAVFGSCAPSGTCMVQAGDSGSSQICYSNGVKVANMSNYDPTAMTFTETITYTKGGAACFTETIAVGASGGGTAMIMDPSGVVVATLTTDADGNATTVTCAGGGSYPITDNTCAPSGSSSATASCTQGVCP